MKDILVLAMLAFCPYLAVLSAQTPVPSAPPPLTLQEKFQLYLSQTHSVSSLLAPAAFAAIDQATDSPKEWGQDGGGYLRRLGTQRGQLQLGNVSAFGIDAALHEDPRFFPSGAHGMWRRTKYVLVHTLVARTDNGRERPAFGNYARALGAGFFPATWLPRSDNSVPDSLRRSVRMLGMEVGVNMGVEFSADNRKFFREKVQGWFKHPRNRQIPQQSGSGEAK